MTPENIAALKALPEKWRKDAERSRKAEVMPAYEAGRANRLDKCAAELEAAGLPALLAELDETWKAWNRVSNELQDVKAEREEIAALKALMEKATPRPWGNDACAIYGRAQGDVMMVCAEPGEGAHGKPFWKDNRALIVAAVNALPALLAELERWHESADDFAAKYADLVAEREEIAALLNISGPSANLDVKRYTDWWESRKAIRARKGRTP